MHDKLTKEQIELMFTQHYVNPRDFTWNGNSVEITHDGMKSVLDNQNLLYENEQLRRTVDYVAGGRDAMMQVMSSSAMPQGQGGIQGGQVMTMEEFLKEFGDQPNDKPKEPPVAPPPQPEKPKE